jgi:3-oxoadipate enol-lactonase
MTTAHLNGIDIHYETHGDGTPLVLAHGYTATLAMWRAQQAAFASRYRLVLYDTRGHGETTAPPDLDAYDLARDYVADQLALMDHLGIGRAYVGGLSMGGMIAQEFALQHPERVAALVLCDTGTGMGLQRDPAVAARFRQMRDMIHGMARKRGMSAVLDAMRDSPMRFRPDGPMPPGVRTHIENMLTMSVDGYVGGWTAMQTWAGTFDRLHRITAPTLVLVGEHDQLVGPSRAIHAGVAGSRFVLMRDAAHGTCVWRPQAFADAVLGFLADVDAGRDVAGEFVV